jgi:gamma-glutamylputrescine oxidase
MSRSERVLTGDFKDTPYWWEAVRPERSDTPLPTDEVDVAIIGSGYTGLCCAIELHEYGVRTVVLDAAELGAGASTRSGAMVTGGQKFVVSGSIEGVPKAQQGLILEDARESLSLVEERVARYKLDADYVRYGRVILAAVPSHYKRLERWAELLGTTGKSTVSLIPRSDLQQEVGGNRYHGGLLIEDYGGLHPAKYHRALCDVARGLGATLISNCPVIGILRDAGRFRLRTPQGELRARNVVVATNGYTGPVEPYLQKRIIPVQAYVVATEPLPAGMAERLIPRRRMLSDTKRNLYWIRLTPDGTRMILGAKPSAMHIDHREAAVRMHRMLCNVWPELRSVRIGFCWSGNVGMSYDRLPHMGIHDGVHYAVGCNGSGVAMMSYLGLQTARKILGRQNRPCAFDSDAFPAPPLYSGSPWFIPVVTSWYDLRDATDRLTG